MLASELKRNMRVRHKGTNYIILEVPPADLGNPKRGIEPSCKFQFTTSMDHFGTTIQVKFPTDEEVEVLS